MRKTTTKLPFSLVLGFGESLVRSTFPAVHGNVSALLGYAGLAFLAALFSAILYLSTFGWFIAPVKLDFDLIWGEFIKGPFVLQTMVTVVWFVAALKPNPEKIDELRFLSSLPVTSRQIFIKFITMELLEIVWVPVTLGISFLILLPLATLAFLTRPIILMTLSCLFCITLQTTLNLLVLPNSRARLHYPVKKNILIQGMIILYFESSLIMHLLIPITWSAWIFWSVGLLLLALTAALLIAANALFGRLLRDNYLALKPRPKTSAEPITRLTRLSRFVNDIFQKAPLLAKNIVQMQRAKTNASAIILAALFLLSAFLLAMNNRHIEDRINVLFGLMILYVVLYGSAVINRHNAQTESTQLIFTLPVNTKQFYFSLLTPALGWLFAVNTAMTIALISAGADPEQLGIFWIKSIFCSAAILTLASSAAVICYPDTRSAQKRFGYWLLAIIIACTILWSWRFYLTAAAAGLSLLPLRGMRFYRDNRN
jgi:hypothetical protein